MKLPRLDLTTGEVLRGKALFNAKQENKYKPEPLDLDDLMARAGPMADAAKTDVEWGAISFWLSGGYETSQPAIAAADIPPQVAKLSVHLVRQGLLHETAWPDLSGKGATPALYDYSPDVQCEARQVAADIYAIWEKIGRPHVDARRCKDTYRYLVASVRKGLIDPLPGIRNTEIALREVKPGSAVDMQQKFLVSF